MSEFTFGNVEHLKRNLEIEGKTGTEIGLDGTDIVLTVLAASDANPQWKANSRKVTSELRRLANANAGAARTREYLAGVYADYLVKDWRGVADGEGNAIAFSREACKAFLMQVDDAFVAIETIVYESKNFRGAKIEAVATRLGE